MARSTLEVINLPHGRPSGSHPIHVIDTEHGMEVRLHGAREVLFYVSNDGPSVATVTVCPGEDGTASNGDGIARHMQVPPLESQFLGPMDTAAFARSGDVLWLDFTNETAGRISVFRFS